MRVAVNAEQLLYRSPGGIGRYTAQLLTVLPRIFPDDEPVPFTARHRHDQVARILKGAGASDETVGRAVVLGLPRPLLYEAWGRLGRPRLPDLGGAELVHAPSVAVPPRHRVPLMVTVHDAAPELFPETFPTRGRKFHHRGLAAAASRADVVVTVSESAAEEIARNSPIPRQRIRVVPNGVAPMAVDPVRRRELLAARQLADRPFVLWVGSFEPRKDVGTLVSAMARIRSGAALVLAGFSGWLGSGLVDDSDRNALGSDLVQLGQVTEEELWALYAGATLFAFPSLHEGFGLPPLEAMSQGTPVVESDIPALREVAGGASRLVAPGRVEEWAAVLEGLLSDEPERRRLGKAGLERSRQFTLDACMRATRSIYAELVGR